MGVRGSFFAGAVAHVLLLASLPACRASSSSPSALVISPSEYFEGNDGPWSSFNVRVGTTQQDARVLVSTAAPETLVVLSKYGCSETVMAKVPSDCAVSRGGLFNQNQSSTWYNLGDFDINDGTVGLEANLGYSSPAVFGMDNLGIGLVDGSGGVSLENQTIGGILTATPFYLGIFGINTQPLNFTSLGNFSAPSFITNLKDQNKIPSLSWSYTAGAMYRLKQVYGQLIFSGYDSSRFTENSVSFTMADDVTRDLVVSLQSITYSGQTQSSLLSAPINIFIDSTDPNLWLPAPAVKAFEKAFDLSLDADSGLYLVSDTQHAKLLASKAEVSFLLSDVADGGDGVAITLPYQAFALQAKYPLVQDTSYYFPLKTAANETQYTLGRAFLQEAYLTADYERRVFNVSQCTWVEGAEQELVTVQSTSSPSKDSSSKSGHKKSGEAAKKSSSFNGAAIAGVVIAAVGAIAIAALIAVFLVRRRRRNDEKKKTEAAKASATASAKSSAVTPQSNYEKMVMTYEDRTMTGTSLGAESSHHGELLGDSRSYQGELVGDPRHIYQLHSESRETVAKTMMPPTPAVEVYEMDADGAVARPQITEPSPIVSPASVRERDDWMLEEHSMVPLTPASFGPR